MATDLEAVAKWHEDSAASYALNIANSVRQWPDEGEPPRYVRMQAFHTEAAAAIRAAMGEIERLRAENERVWRERNRAITENGAWRGVLYMENLPVRAVQVAEWGPGEGEHVTLPELTPQRLTDLLDEVATLRAKVRS
jgi:hypothetical protein